MKTEHRLRGADIVIATLLKLNVRTVFGYIGGAIMPVYDALVDYPELRHIMIRHEQCAVHAAQGYARASGGVGVCFTTSGPGATNIVTGVADAMNDSTPVVCITGQVHSALLGTDAFQEQFISGITIPLTKWNYLVTRADEIEYALVKAFAIAGGGRPGPVIIDITKNAQMEYAECKNIIAENLSVVSTAADNNIDDAVACINASSKPLVLAGHGVILSHAENELRKFCEKIASPVGLTLLGLTALPSCHILNSGLIGMHGHYAPNLLNRECDCIIGIGMRFDDRVTSSVKDFAQNARIIHIDIDNSEINKIVKCDIGLCGDAKDILEKLTSRVNTVGMEKRYDWLEKFRNAYQIEYEKVIKKQLMSGTDSITMAQIITAVGRKCKNNAIIVTDVGQHQMMTALYYSFTDKNCFITSGGLGTMGFGLPAALGAAISEPCRDVILFVGDGGIQMTIQELNTLRNLSCNVKIILLNNHFLGMVRQWQELFFDRRYSQTDMENNPDFVQIAHAYGISAESVFQSHQIDAALEKMFSCQDPYLLEVHVIREENVFPMVCSGDPIYSVRLE